MGGLPEKFDFEVIEPFRELFKDEVREIGRLLGVPELIVGRHPFPGPGLAVRIIGPVTRESLAMLREADAIFIEELRLSGCTIRYGRPLRCCCRADGGGHG